MQHPNLPDLLSELRSYLERLYDQRLVSLMLFGSQARADADPDSDIDVLVVLEGEVDAWAEIERTGEFVSHLCLEYGVVICNIFVSAAQFQAQQTAFLRTVQQEGVKL
jgi:uncharacterized protein